ncbi:MAG: hypothetical protein ACYS3S_00435 [Planctomycetota bacterium]|jgi:hypothetical protein
MKMKAGLIEGAFEVKKKINMDIKAAFRLIIAENIIALRNVIRAIITSISKTVRLNGGSILPGSRKKA